MSYMSELDAETRQEYLSDVSTKELVDELAKREGVSQILCPDEDVNYRVSIESLDGWEDCIRGCEPARILVVIDR